LGIGQRLEQNALDNAENGRGRADAERQRENGNQAEAGFLQKHSRDIAQVMNQRLDKPQTPHLVTHIL
jgi:hypothetical protein